MTWPGVWRGYDILVKQSCGTASRLLSFTNGPVKAQNRLLPSTTRTTCVRRTVRARGLVEPHLSPFTVYSTGDPTIRVRIRADFSLDCCGHLNAHRSGPAPSPGRSSLSPRTKPRRRRCSNPRSQFSMLKEPLNVIYWALHHGHIQGDCRIVVRR